jgi:hypothetical protein
LFHGISAKKAWLSWSFSGPLSVGAALEAVRQWVYQPTLLEGKPVEVDTTIDVIFQLSARNQERRDSARTGKRD